MGNIQPSDRVPPSDKQMIKDVINQDHLVNQTDNNIGGSYKSERRLDMNQDNNVNQYTLKGWI